MRRFLFEPFHLGTWLVVAFTAWLAQLGSGGGPGSTWNLGGSDDRHRALASIGDVWSRLLEHAILIPVIVLVALFALVLLVVLLYVSSRGKLIFLDNVVRGRAAVVEPWHRLRRLGNSLFLWRVGFGLICLVVVVSVLFMFLAPAIAAGSWHDPLAGLSIAAAVLGAVVLAVLALLALVVSVLLDSFVVPLMYRFDLTATAAWRALMPWLHAQLGHFILYLMFVFLLCLFLAVCTLLVCLVTCLACCIWLIPLVGSYLMTAVLLPFWVTYRAFTVEWLAQLDPRFDLFAFAAAAAPAVELQAPPVG